jgi:PAS domain S-box-containing protein
VIPDIRLSDETFGVRHRALRTVLTMLLPVIVGMAAFQHQIGGLLEQPHAGHTRGVMIVWVMVAATAACAVAAGLIRSRRAGSLVVSLGLLLGSAALVHAGGGLTDLHFAFFVVLGLISLYQEWLTLVMSVGLVFVHHMLVGFVVPGVVFSDPHAWRHPVFFALLHAVFVLAMCAVQLAYWRFIHQAQVEIRSVQEQAAEEVRRREAKFRGLLEAAPDAIVGVTPDGCITLVNAQTERLFGYNRDELLGQPIEILVPDGARAVHPEHRTGYFSRPRPRTMGAGMQLAARRKDGTEFPAEISLSALDTEDGPVVSAAVRDVTDRIEAQAERERLKTQAERERLEAQLHQSQRLESLGQLAGGVAHDFNNLLAVMLNYSSFVAEEITDAAAEDSQRWQAARHDIAQVQRAGQRATDLTHQLLAFGRREVVKPRVLSLNTVVSEVDALLHRTLGEHVELHTTLAPDLWPVLADPGQLEQVLVNLAVNARDAMPDGGVLSIDTANEIIEEAGAVTRPGLHPGRYVRLRVSDTGFGIPPEVAERVFEPFFTTKPKGEGTGLGLATVYGIITQAGGRAQIASSPGAGTAFTALLPVTFDQPSRTEQVTPAPSRRKGGETILVVEDEEALRDVTARILTRNGYRVLTAASGAEAFKTAEHSDQPIDLLLTDVIMPQMLGKELAAGVRDRYPDTRVLYMSGYAQPILASQGTLDLGVILVEKPFTEPDLLDHVGAVLDAPPPDTLA